MMKTFWKLLFHAMEHGKEGDLPHCTNALTVISMENGKMLDVDPLSKVSKACREACIISTLVPKQLLKSSKPLGHKSRSFLCCWSKGSRSTS